MGGRFPDAAIPSALYGVLGLATATAYWVLVRAIIRANGKDSQVARAVRSDRKGKLSLVLYAAGAGLAFLTPFAAYAAYVAVALMWFVPDRRLAPEST